MIKRIPPDWVESNWSDPFAEIRVYIDPRGMEYPVYSGTPAYTEVSGVYNAPGYYYLTSTLNYLLIPSSTFSAEVLYINTSGGTHDSYLLRFLGGYTITLKHVSTGGYSLTAVGGTTVTCTGGSTQARPQRVGFSLTYGGAMTLYVDGVAVDTDTAPALTTNPWYMEVNGSANSSISYVRLFNGYAVSATEFGNNFAHVGNEEIFWKYDLTAYGRTRCNVDRSGNHLITAYSIERGAGYKAATASVTFNNLSGEFSDDQYATFTPASGAYNGTSSQAYLKHAVGLEIECWEPNPTPTLPSNSLYPSNTLYPSGNIYTFEPVFRGWIPPGGFSRSTSNGGLSTVTVSAEDGIVDIARRRVRKARVWEDYYLSRETPSSNSVFHEIAWLATKREVYNYLCNASFEAATISDSWATDGTFARDTTQVINGTYCGKFSGTDKKFYQTVTLADITAGEQFTGSIYVYSASAITGKITVQEKTGSTVNGYTESSFTHSGKGWDLVSVTHTVTNSASTTMCFVVTSVGSWTNVPVDCAMLKYGNAIPWWVANTNAGSSGIAPLNSEALGSYDWVGIDADDVSYQHTWARIDQDDSVWDNMKQVADACLARTMHIDSAGVLRFRSAFANPSIAASNGSITGISSVSAGTQSPVANRIEVRGAKIAKATTLETVWEAAASGLESDTGKKAFYRSLDNTDTIPESATDGVTEIEARYTLDIGGDK